MHHDGGRVPAVQSLPPRRCLALRELTVTGSCQWRGYRPEGAQYETQRCWRLCSLLCSASNGPDLLIPSRHAFVYLPGCCGYSKVLKSRGVGLLILLKLTLVSDDGVYIIVAQPKAICYGRTGQVRSGPEGLLLGRSLGP